MKWPSLSSTQSKRRLHILLPPHHSSIFKCNTVISRREIMIYIYFHLTFLISFDKPSPPENEFADETRTSLTLDPRATKKLAAHHTLAARRWQNANLSITYSNYYDVIDGLALAAPKPTITIVGCVKCYKQQDFSFLVADVLREQMK